MKYTKAQLEKAMYLLLDIALPYIKCELIEQRGNYLCERCDDCMFEQFIKRAKDPNILTKKESQTNTHLTNLTQSGIIKEND